MSEMKPKWTPYNQGGGYEGRQWVADGVTVIVMCTAEWYVRWGTANGIYGTAISVAAAERYALRARVHAIASVADHAEMQREQRWPTGLSTLMREVIGKFPAAADHLPGEPILPAVIPRKGLDPRWHFEVKDDDLRALAYGEILRHNDFQGTDIARYHGTDAVLVLAPAR